jgi:DNA-binding response OmpR family regulator
MSDNGHQPHILAMDYSQEVLTLIRDVLVEADFQVTITLLVGQSLADIVKIAPDLIILDYMLARDQTGWDLLQALKGDSRTSSIPLVLCTGAIVETEEFREDLELLGVHIVFKPFDIDELVGVVRASLAR